jgi:hypothetical protein
MTANYRYRTYQYIGPTLDQNIYQSPFLLTSGNITEPTNIQWVTDPTAECSAEQKRLRIRNGIQRKTVAALETDSKPAVYQYRPFLE